MKVGILALQGDVSEHAAALEALGAEPIPVRSPADVGALQAIVLPGGESTTMSLLLESSGLGPVIADALDAGLPAFGTCAGLILLAKDVLDGRPDQRSFGTVDVSVRRNAYGRQVDSFECDLDVPVLGGAPLPAVFIRAPGIERVGPAVEVLARLPGHVGRGGGPPVLCRQGRNLVAAFHPELVNDLRVHELFLDGVQGACCGDAQR